MGKKGRQNDPSMNTDDSTESCDENQNTSLCAHINKAVDLVKIKKALQRGGGFLEDCEDCKRDPARNGFEMNTDIEYDHTLWLCLKCGNQACGRGKNQHAIHHWKTPHSDNHALCVNTTVWSVWCYECDDEVNVACRKKLLECVEYLKKHADSNNVKNQIAVTNSSQDKVIELDFHTAPIGLGKSEVNVARTCGLTNLGNTCFFNSVMQCLGQTPYLLELLDETSQPGQYFKLPGGKLTPEDKESMILEPLDGNLEEWKPLTRYLAETLRELQSGRSDVYTPRMLHSKLTQRLPQFGGGDQHDSHELLRHLLEAVREEDLRRYQAVILDKLGFSKKTDPSTVEGDKRKIIKFYGQQASDMLLPTEQVFRGILVSTLQCQVCEHTSYRDEFFLDLSLPIVEKQVPPVLRRKADELDDNKPTKHQMKKEKKAARKAKKHKPHRNVIDYNNKNVSLDSQSTENNSESESDADVEDNAEDTSTTTIPNSTETEKSSNGSTKGPESGYHSEKVDNGSPTKRKGSPLNMSVDESPQIGMCSASPLNPCSVENSPSSSETNIDMGSPLLGRSSPAELNEDFERPESRLSFVNNKNMEVDLAQLSLLTDGDRTLNSSKSEGLDNRLEEACKRLEEEDDEDEKMEEDFDIDMWTGTMSARYKCEEGECSVQSCLNQFTACELMTANNKVGCELCTKREGGTAKKTVYTDARKQLLIYNPPAVLILHLKRFQVSFFRPSKMSKHVSFPILLDIAPFCSKRSQNLPTFEVGQSKVLYSLYGVVEHSGSLHGGHYVAYVKVRPKLEDNSYRWNFLPKNQKDKCPDTVKGAQGEPQAPAGKWYYVSDSHVSEVQESRVLKAQAYLLFYERIM